MVAVRGGGCGGGGDAPAGGGGGGGGRGGAAGKGVVCQDTGQRPSGRSEMMGALDSKRHRMLFFGGDDGFPKNCNPAPHAIGELWSYDVACGSFEQLEVGEGPGPRARGAAVYDEAGDRLVVFGGRYRKGSSGAYKLYNETWALDLATMSWQELATTGAPSARSNATAVYVAATRQMVVFGGNTSTDALSFTPLNDVWTLDLETLAWSPVTTTGTKPKTRLFHTAAVDPAGSRLFVYGGGGVGAFQGPFYADLWSLDLATGAWLKLHNGGASAPRGRIWSTMMFVPEKEQLLLFGGHDDGEVGNNNDTWSFDLASKKWEALVPAEVVKTKATDFCVFPPDFTAPNLAAPDRRSAHMAGFDAGRGEWVIFGGKTDCGLIDDAWHLDVASGAWSRKVEANFGEACLRRANPDQCTNLCL